jgi:hypothetical protein
MIRSLPVPPSTRLSMSPARQREDVAAGAGDQVFDGRQRVRLAGRGVLRQAGDEIDDPAVGAVAVVGGVAARAAVQDVLAGPAHQRVVAACAEQGLGGRGAIDGVVQAVAVHGQAGRRIDQVDVQLGRGQVIVVRAEVLRAIHRPNAIDVVLLQAVAQRTGAEQRRVDRRVHDRQVAARRLMVQPERMADLVQRGQVEVAGAGVESPCCRCRTRHRPHTGRSNC